MLTRPINNNNMLVAPTSNAVDRLAGAISMQMIPTGTMTGRNPFLKSLITSCFLLSKRLRNMNNASLARSELWKVRLMIGNRIHRLPSFNFTPKNKVYINKGIDSINKIRATLEYSE